MTEIPYFLRKNFKTEIGTHQFTEADIIRYGKKLLPADFHTDEQKAKLTPHRSLIAVGLHIASVWMSLQRTFIQESTESLMLAGKTFPIFGPSPGVEYMNWPNPVFAGDIITYENHIQNIRESGSRPGWWVMTNRVTGTKESGKIVMEFQSSVLLTLKKDT